MNIEKLKEDATWLKEQLAKKVIDIDTINKLINNILVDNTNITTDTKQVTDENIKPSSDNDKVLTENDVITLFKSFLKTKCDPKGNLIKTWSTSETLSSQELQDILAFAKDNKSDYFVDAATDYISDDYANILVSMSNKLIAEFYSIIGLKEKDIYKAPPFDRSLLENCINELKLNVNAKQLLNQSSIDDLTIYFKTKYDTTLDFMRILNKPEFLTNKQYTALDWLLESQGYTRNDLISISKRNSSIFLKSLYAEINNYRKHICYSLIAVPNTTDFKLLLRLSRNGNVIIKKSTRFGLVNSYMNDTCGVNITLEKDIVVNKNTPLASIHLTYRDSTSDTPCISSYKSPSATIPNLRDTRNEDLEIYDKYDREYILW